MRKSIDVLRSVKKYIAEDVLPDYEVRLSSEEGAWERPFCRVAWSTSGNQRAIGKLQLELRRTLSIVVWPVESATADEGKLVAEAVVEALTLAFSMGLHTDSYRSASNRAHPRRIPVWDYDGVPLTAAVAENARATTDFATVIDDPEIGDIDDPNTPKSRVVTGDIRLRWTRSVAVAAEGEVVVGVPLESQAS
ncbi:MAG: hypothetical protein ABW167_20640 [Baekduia sp.]